MIKQNAKKMPLKSHENICIFYKKLHTYNPQGLIRIDRKIKSKPTKGGRSLLGDDYSKVQALNKDYVQKFKNYPKSMLEINKKAINAKEKNILDFKRDELDKVAKYLNKNIFNKKRDNEQEI